MGGPGSGQYPAEDPAKYLELCRIIPDSPNVSTALKQLGLDWRRLGIMRKRHPEVDEAYREATNLLAHRLAHEALDDLSVGQLLALPDPKLASAAANLASQRNRHRQWLASRLAPDDFSESITHKGTVNHQHAVVVLPPLDPVPQALTGSVGGGAGVIGDGGQRAIGPGQAQPVVDAELVRDDHTTIDASATDSVSVTPRKSSHDKQ